MWFLIVLRSKWFRVYLDHLKDHWVQCLYEDFILICYSFVQLFIISLCFRSRTSIRFWLIWTSLIRNPVGSVSERGISTPKERLLNPAVCILSSVLMPVCSATKTKLDTRREIGLSVRMKDTNRVYQDWNVQVSLTHKRPWSLTSVFDFTMRIIDRMCWSVQNSNRVLEIKQNLCCGFTVQKDLITKEKFCCFKLVVHVLQCTSCMKVKVGAAL